MLTKIKDIWDDDLRHISDSFVAGIISTFASASGYKTTDTEQLILGFTAMSVAGNTGEALRLFAEIKKGLAVQGMNFESIQTIEFHRNAATLMAHVNRLPEAIHFTSIIRKMRPHKHGPYIREFNLRIQTGDMIEAIQVAISGLKTCSTDSIVLLKKAIEKSFDEEAKKQIYATTDQ